MLQLRCCSCAACTTAAATAEQCIIQLLLLLALSLEDGYLRCLRVPLLQAFRLAAPDRRQQRLHPAQSSSCSSCAVGRTAAADEHCFNQLLLLCCHQLSTVEAVAALARKCSAAVRNRCAAASSTAVPTANSRH
jgi:hypothetical protein